MQTGRFFIRCCRLSRLIILYLRLISGALLLMVGEAVFGVSVANGLFLLGMVVGALCFAAMGAVVGLLVTDVDEISLVNNFFITPMIFFGGSFFPLSNLPEFLAQVAGLLPIRALNTVLRAATFDGEVMLCLSLMLVLTIAFFVWGLALIRNYSE
jgi:ABC-type multidrug transport system permease subunit